MSNFDFEISIAAYHEDEQGSIIRTTNDMQIAAMIATQLVANIFDDNKNIKLEGA